MPHRFLPHTADVKVEIEAATLDGVLVESVAVVRELVAGESPVEELRSIPVSIRQPDSAELVRAFVRLLLDLFNTEAFISRRLEIQHRANGSLTGWLHGERCDESRHAAQPEVKALTRHEFAVHETPGSCRVELLFDV